MVMIFAGGHVSGAHYNPAVTLAVWIRGRCATKDVFPYMAAQVAAAVAVGAGVMNLLKFSDLWIHLAADLAGGAAAGMAFKRINPDDR